MKIKYQKPDIEVIAIDIEDAVLQSSGLMELSLDDIEMNPDYEVL